MHLVQENAFPSWKVSKNGIPKPMVLFLVDASGGKLEKEIQRTETFPSNGSVLPHYASVENLIQRRWFGFISDSSFVWSSPRVGNPPGIC